MNETIILIVFFILAQLSNLDIIPFTPREILGMKDAIVNTLPPPAELPGKSQAVVQRIVDGDTIKVTVGGQEKTVRLIGIDTPETVDPRKEVECFGKEASNKAKEVLSNKTVYLQADPSQGDVDKYQRILRYVFLEDGTNVNQMMITEGFAYEYTYAAPYNYQKEFQQAQKDAQRLNKGLWATGVCNVIGT